jgi:hypothetical protein
MRLPPSPAGRAVPNGVAAPSTLVMETTAKVPRKQVAGS